jgi:hypothetical protein
MGREQFVSIGDIVLFQQSEGVSIPGIIDALLDQDHAVLTLFSGGGAGGSANALERGTAVGQWQPRTREDRFSMEKLSSR